MAFDFSFEDLIDDDDGDVGPSPSFGSAVLNQQKAEGGPTETTRSSSDQKTLSTNIFSWSSLLQGQAIFGRGSDVLNVVNNYMSGLLGGTIGVGGNEDEKLGGGFDNLIPQDVKNKAKKLRAEGVGADIGKTAAVAAPATPDPTAPTTPAPGGIGGVVGDAIGGGGNTSAVGTQGCVYPLDGGKDQWTVIQSWFPPGGHPGMDLIAANGQTQGRPVLAMKAGVAHLWPNDKFTGAGNMIQIDHGGGLWSMCMHLSAYSVADGDSVAQGQEVGKVGSTGNSTGPHLHIEVHAGVPDFIRFSWDGHNVDPRPYLGY